MTKICTKCKIEKTLYEFTKDNRRKDGVTCWCKICQNAYICAYRKTPKGKASSRACSLTYSRTEEGKLAQRNAHFKRRYGQTMTVDKYNELLVKQNGVCAICGKHETMIDKRSGKVRALDIDHCHETKQVRGLLCHSCNVGIGLLKHSPARIRKAADYLESNTNDFI